MHVESRALTILPNTLLLALNGHLASRWMLLFLKVTIYSRPIFALSWVWWTYPSDMYIITIIITRESRYNTVFTSSMQGA